MIRPANAFAIALVSALTAFGAEAHAARVLELKNMAARVIIEPGAREDIVLTVDYGTRSDIPKIMVKTSGDKLIADGQMNLRGETLTPGADTVRLSGALGQVALTDLPVIRVQVPMNVTLSAGRGIYIGEVGKSDAVNLNLEGEGSWTLSDVTGEAAIFAEGGETIAVTRAGSANVALKGAATVSFETVSDLKAATSGSGRFSIGTLTGPAQLSHSGSGSVTIREGGSPSLTISSTGTGTVRFDGVAEKADVSVTGSGRVALHKVTGPVRKSIAGTGTVSIGQ